MFKTLIQDWNGKAFQRYRFFIAVGCGAFIPLFGGVLEEASLQDSSVKERLLKEWAEGEISPDFSRSHLDLSVPPWEDFYRFAVGNWHLCHPRPEYATIWRGFEVIREEVYLRLQRVLLNEEEQEGALKSALALYQSGRNVEKRQQAGWGPVLPLMEKVMQIEEKSELPTLFSLLQEAGLSPFVEVGAIPHPEQANFSITCLQQGGLLLPGHEVYLEESDSEANQHASLREGYSSYIAHLFHILSNQGVGEANWAQKALRVEKRLASRFLSKAQLRQPELSKRICSLEDLERENPSLGWRHFFSQRSVTPSAINVRQESYLMDLEEVIGSSSLEEIQAYLLLHIAGKMAPFLSEETELEHFDFFEGRLRGATTPLSLDQRCIALVNRLLGDAMGKAYVTHYFTAEDKGKVEEMVEAVRQSLHRRLGELSWLSEETKKQAAHKLEKMSVEIGYPAEGKETDYSSLPELDPKASYGENILQVMKFLNRLEWSEVEKEVVEGAWFCPPQTVNAYSDPTSNTITFPAGILSSPIWMDDPTLSWGAFGVVIAHEMIHCFDDQGRKYDGEGNQRDWWTEEDSQAYSAHAKVIQDQFDRYPIHFSDGSSLNVKGDFCLGENIADLGGLIIAYAAFEKWLETHPQPMRGGFSPQQRFFLGWAQCWAMDATEEEMRFRLQNDCHSPGVWRVNGPLSQLPAFRKAFAVEEGDPMWIEREGQSWMWLSSSGSSQGG